MRFHSAVGRSAAIGILVLGCPLAAATEPAASTADPAPDQRLHELLDRAGGDPADPETREATFELAHFRLARPDLAEPRQIIAEWVVAVGRFPDDPRTLELLPHLADLQLQIGDVYGAQQAFKQEFRLRRGFGDPARAALAAHTAARARDMSPALEWTEPYLVAEMSDVARADLYLARLKAGAALKRTDVALEAARALELHSSEALHTDPEAVMTAAAVHASIGEDEQSTRLLSVAANIHLTHERRPDVLLQLARQYARSGRSNIARETYNQLTLGYPESRPAWLARIELLADPDRPMQPADIATYLETARQAPAPELIETLCDAMFNRLVAAGYPLEAFMAVARLSAEDSLAGLVARRRAGTYLAAALELVVARRSRVEIAGLSQVALELGLPLPAPQLARINEKRRQLGLAAAYGAPFDSALREAREHFRQARYDQAIDGIRAALDALRPLATAPLDWRVAIGRIFAEATWRQGRDSEALSHLEALIAEVGDGAGRRELLLLQADLLFGSDRPRSCALYASLAGAAPTPWIRSQHQRCAAPAATETADTGAGAEDAS